MAKSRIRRYRDILSDIGVLGDNAKILNKSIRNFHENHPESRDGDIKDLDVSKIREQARFLAIQWLESDGRDAELSSNARCRQQRDRENVQEKIASLIYQQLYRRRSRIRENHLCRTQLSSSAAIDRTSNVTDRPVNLRSLRRQNYAEQCSSNACEDSGPPTESTECLVDTIEESEYESEIGPPSNSRDGPHLPFGNPSGTVGFTPPPSERDLNEEPEIPCSQSAAITTHDNRQIGLSPPRNFWTSINRSSKPQVQLNAYSLPEESETVARLHSGNEVQSLPVSAAPPISEPVSSPLVSPKQGTESTGDSKLPYTDATARLFVEIERQKLELERQKLEISRERMELDRESKRQKMNHRREEMELQKEHLLIQQEIRNILREKATPGCERHNNIDPNCHTCLRLEAHLQRAQNRRPKAVASHAALFDRQLGA